MTESLWYRRASARARTRFPTVVFVLATLVVTFGFHGCASQYAPSRLDHPFGFLMGVWHGLICPVAILGTVASWVLGVFDVPFLEGVAILGRPNSGIHYYLGFLLGLGLGALEAQALDRESDLHRALGGLIRRVRLPGRSSPRG